jgi:hypothetical protein
MLKNRILKRFVCAAVFSSVILAAQAHAATISYFIDQSNDLPDGVNYAQVTISDSTDVAGDIDFTVELLTDMFVVGGNNYGMQSFLFNHDDALSLDVSNITGLSQPWKISTGKNAGGGFSKFDVQLSGKGSSRTDLLTFSITGIDGDSIYSYAIGSSLNPAAEEYFSMHIAGFDEFEGFTSAKFAGSLVVPVPAAAWLFGSGLIGLVAVARRKA